MAEIVTQEQHIERLVLDGLDLGLTRKVAKLYEIATSPNAEPHTFERGLVLAMQRYVQAVDVSKDIFADIASPKTKKGPTTA